MTNIYPVLSGIKFFWVGRNCPLLSRDGIFYPVLYAQKYQSRKFFFASDGQQLTHTLILCCVMCLKALLFSLFQKCVAPLSPPLLVLDGDVFEFNFCNKEK